MSETELLERDAKRFRFLNRHSAFAEYRDGKVVVIANTKLYEGVHLRDAVDKAMADPEGDSTRGGQHRDDWGGP